MGKIDYEYMNKLYESFRRIAPGKCIEIEIEKVGIREGEWIIPEEFRQLFKSEGIRIENAEIFNREGCEGEFTYMMYKTGGDPGITLTYL